MNTAPFATLLRSLFSELVHGSPDPSERTYMLNQGDVGLLASLNRISAAAASATHGGPSIAAHVDHLRYGLSLLVRRAHRLVPNCHRRPVAHDGKRNVGGVSYQPPGPRNLPRSAW